MNLRDRRRLRALERGCRTWSRRTLQRRHGERLAVRTNVPGPWYTGPLGDLERAAVLRGLIAGGMTRALVDHVGRREDFRDVIANVPRSCECHGRCDPEGLIPLDDGAWLCPTCEHALDDGAVAAIVAWAAELLCVGGRFRDHDGLVIAPPAPRRRV